MIENFAGARWWKFDFHAHTPASRCGAAKAWRDAVGKADEVTPDRWLLAFMQADVDCVAITDHNTGEWVDRLKVAYQAMTAAPPAGFRPIVLFPGVEISVNGGFHLLALLDPDKGANDVERLLGRVGYTGTPGESDGTTRESASEVVRIITQELGGIAVPAHADDAKGLLEKRDGTNGLRLDTSTVKEVLRQGGILAAEIVDSGCTRPQVYQEAKLSWTEVVGSDCHSFRGDRAPGSRFTWVKMCRPPSMEGLKLALLDGAPLSIRRSDAETGNPNDHPRLALEQLVVSDLDHAGRGRPMTVRFSPWLTTLIGGRGTGKSTVVELLRMALERAPTPGTAPDVHEGTNNFERIARSLREATRVEVVAQKDGARYRIHWRRDGAAHFEEELEEGVWEQAEGTIRSRFPARIISQKEVFSLAEEQGALLGLVDETDAVQREDWESQWKTLENRFLRLRTQMREVDVRLTDRQRLAGELADVKRQLAVFEDGESKELLTHFQRLRRQRAAVEDRRSEVEHTVQLLRETASEIEPSDIREGLFPADEAASRGALEVLREAVSEQHRVRGELHSLAERLTEFRESWWGRVADSTWAKAGEQVDRAYQELVARLREEGVEDPSGYGALVQKRTELERRLAEITSLERRREELRTASAGELQELERWRLELTGRRQRFLDDVLAGNQYVRISVIPFCDDASAAEASFRRAFAREDGRLESDILVTRDDGAQSGLLAQLYDGLEVDLELRKASFCQRLREMKSLVLTIRDGEEVRHRTKWFHNHVRELQPEQLDRLELWWPPDGLRVEYRRPSGAFASVKEGSPGQKSAAILAFILSYSDEPLILDQPEDDLDNHLISDLIVAQIRENKARRQVIVATHNPNIVVNGDAEMVVAMDHHGGQCVVLREGAGCLQSEGVRDEVCRVMEGGRKAFEERYRRIIGEARHV